jgi:hypothetical protein
MKINGMTPQAWRLEARRRSRYVTRWTGRKRGLRVISYAGGYWAQRFARSIA